MTAFDKTCAKQPILEARNTEALKTRKTMCTCFAGQVCENKKKNVSTFQVVSQAASLAQKPE